MNQLDLQNRRAVITGGARGIGYAIATRMLQSGASVSLWDLNAEALAGAARELSSLGHVETVEMNMTDESSVAAATEQTVAALGGIDILVNNAGITGNNGKTWELPAAEWRRVIDINLVGPFLCCRAIIPKMLAGGFGRIVNIASIAGKEGNPNASHYSAAKAGLIALTKSLGKELATSNILVNCIAPAVIETEMLKQMTQQHVDYMLSKIPMGRFGQAVEAAALVAWLCTED
ncbi:MAG TPA: SDR family NAD(P)-dependent oxidoreductase, partial [Chthoniobacteraceae bacterium]|nr:SDR family NAD(P)-dependent oxidoreductase [Chthoniobacteraceae bacterium]